MFWLFDSPDSTSPRTVLTLTLPGQNQNNVLNHTPTFRWSAKLGYPGDFQSKFQMQVGTDNEWSTVEMWDSGEMSSADTTVVYAGATLLDGATYFARVRIENGFVWSDWYLTTFRMNTPPAAPTPLRPISDVLTAYKPKLYIANSVDAEGDSPLIYAFEIFSDSLLTTLVASNTYVPGTSDSTAWTCNINLSYDTRYWWRANATDNLELGPYSAVSTFIVQGAPLAPTAPVALSPIDTGGWPVFNLNPTFDWSDATDPNPVDTLTYRLRIGTDSLFFSAVNYNNLPVSEYTPSTALLYNKQYWWRVTAQDNTGLTGPISNIPSFWTWTLGDVNHSHSMNVLDLTYMVDRLFRGGPPIVPLFVGDVNGDCGVNVLDLTYMIDRLFRGGPAPVPGC
jgi:hypothetical protein